MIRDIFGGLLRTEFHVEGRSQVTVTFEPFFDLQLEISKCGDLENCLSSFFEEKPLSDYKDDGRVVRAYHQQRIEQLPNILIVQLKRFQFFDRAVKLKEDIEFPEVLTIEEQYISSKLSASNTGAAKNIFTGERGTRYRLFSIIIHKGTEATKGHYVCYSLDNRNDWVLFDDAKVKKVPSIDTVLNSQAYMLFYEKII